MSGGAIEDPYQILEISNIAGKNIQSVPVILVSKPPKVATIGALSEFGKTGLTLSDILAVNGVVVLKQLVNKEAQTDIQKRLYVNPSAKTIATLVDLQVEFISIFHHLYFLAKVSGVKNIPEFNATFTSKFFAIQNKIKADFKTLLKNIFGIQTSEVYKFITILHNAINSELPDTQILIQNLKLLSQNPRLIYDKIGSEKINKNLDKKTEDGYNGLSTTSIAPKVIIEADGDNLSPEEAALINERFASSGKSKNKEAVGVCDNIRKCIENLAENTLLLKEISTTAGRSFVKIGKDWVSKIKELDTLIKKNKNPTEITIKTAEAKKMGEQTRAEYKNAVKSYNDFYDSERRLISARDAEKTGRNLQEIQDIIQNKKKVNIRDISENQKIAIDAGETAAENAKTANLTSIEIVAAAINATNTKAKELGIDYIPRLYATIDIGIEIYNQEKPSMTGGGDKSSQNELFELIQNTNDNNNTLDKAEAHILSKNITKYKQQMDPFIVSINLYLQAVINKDKQLLNIENRILSTSKNIINVIEDIDRNTNFIESTEQTIINAENKIIIISSEIDRRSERRTHRAEGKGTLQSQNIKSILRRKTAKNNIKARRNIKVKGTRNGRPTYLKINPDLSRGINLKGYESLFTPQTRKTKRVRNIQFPVKKNGKKTQNIAHQEAAEIFNKSINEAENDIQNVLAKPRKKFFSYPGLKKGIDPEDALKEMERLKLKQQQYFANWNRQGAERQAEEQNPQ